MWIGSRFHSGQFGEGGGEDGGGGAARRSRQVDDGVEVLAPLVGVGRMDELEVEAFVRQPVVGKGAAEYGEKYES